MKKNNLFLLSIAVVLVLTACSSNQVIENTTVSETVAETKQESKKTFTVGFDSEYPPYGYVSDNGDYVGFDLDLAQEVCNRNNMTLVKQPIDWDSKDMELNSNNIDCIWNGFTMTGREDKYEWTMPYVDNSIVAVVLKDSGISTLTDLQGKSVVTQAGSSGLAALESEENKDLLNSFGKLETCADYNTAFMQLESGLNDCIVVDISVAKYQLQTKPDKFIIVEPEINKEQYSVGFKKGNTALRDLVNNTLDEMAKDGTILKIANNYQEYNVPDMLCIGK